MVEGNTKIKFINKINAYCNDIYKDIMNLDGFSIKYRPSIEIDLKDSNLKIALIESNKIKVGDLLSSTGPEGGHIAMIVGIDNDYIYVSESLWTPPNVSVTVVAYPKTSAVKKKSGSKYEVVNKRYYWVMLMDSYYKEDGNLTTLWY